MIYKVNESTGNQEYLGDKYLLSVSGGKDSTAMILYLKEIAVRKEQMQFVFMDTGWESSETYGYLEYLESELEISIDRIRAGIQIKDEHAAFYSEIMQVMEREHSDFVAMVLNSGMFPSGFRQICTPILKVNPFIDYLEQFDEQFVSCVGIRREESSRRSTYQEYEFKESQDLWVWRPLIDWTEKDVIEIHHRHQIKPNNLYLKGSQRVGCFPCIRSNKTELSEFPTDHAQIKVIRLLENYLSSTRGKRITFFKNRSIDETLEWSQTSRGGQQFFLFSPHEETCVKWGMCGI